MKYILILQLFLSGAFAHGGAESHVHFFSSLHAGDFVLFLIGLVGTYLIYSKLFKGSN